jgi:hypothetical protein
MMGCCYTFVARARAMQVYIASFAVSFMQVEYAFRN